MVATCPIDQCDYTGPSRSVEAHISGSSDENHKGELGRNWRQTIEASHREEETDREGPTEGASESTEAETETERSEGGLGVPPGVAIVLASVALGVVVVATSAGGGSATVEPGEEEVEETDEPAGSGW
jgi:hypothetical protein